MAAYNRAPFPQQRFRGNYSRNEFQNNVGPRCGNPQMYNFNGSCPPMMQQTFNANMGRPPMQRFSGPNPYQNRPEFCLNNEQMRRPPPSGLNMSMSPPMNRMMGSDMFRLPFPGPTFMPRTRLPSNDRFFVPWNEGPKHFSTEPPNRPKPKLEQKPLPKPTEPKKKNKKKKHKPRPREESKRLKPWMTDDIYDEVRKKNDLFHLAKADNKPETWQEFKAVRNKLGSMIKEAKSRVGMPVRRHREEDDGEERLFACDVCDRVFVDNTGLETHIKGHIKCNYSGCFYEAHPKLVDLHKKMLHETGYADTILKLKTSEDIEKWRQERRSHYPTAENVKKRKAEQVEKVARGEIIETEDFGKFKKRRGCNNRGQGRQRQRQRPTSSKQSHQVNDVCTTIDSDSDSDSHINLPPFPGMTAMDVGSSVSSDVQPQVYDISSTTEDSVVKLLDSHGADKSDDITIVKIISTSESGKLPPSPLQPDEDKEVKSDKSENITIVKAISTSEVNESTSLPLHPNENDVINCDADDDDDAPVVLTIIKSLDDDVQLIENNKKKNEKYARKEPQRKSKGPRSKIPAANTDHWPAGMRRNNLLDKLLAKEVRQERNKILQCIRYITNKNFFEK